MGQNYWTRIGAVLWVAFLSGCATVVQGRTQSIGVGSTPPGAMVVIDDQQHVTTPATVALPRNQNHTFLFRKEGYQDDSFTITSGTSGWVWGNVLLGGLVGGMVDFATGAARKLSQDSIHVTLVPLPAAEAPTPALVPAVVTTGNDSGSGQLEAKLVELKNLLDKGLITQDEYGKKRAEILTGF